MPSYPLETGELPPIFRALPSSFARTPGHPGTKSPRCPYTSSESPRRSPGFSDHPKPASSGIITVAGLPIGIVSVVFGILGMRLAANTLKTFLRRPDDRIFWWYDHLQGMIASYIAAMTAFSSVNLSQWFGAAWWVWLWPTMLGAPAIAIWTAYYKKKFASSRQKVAA